MIVPEWGTVSITEAIWTLLGAFGVGFSYAGLRDAITDREEVIKVEAGGNDVLEVLANAAVRNERAIMGFQSVFTLVGIVAMLLPSGDPETSWLRLGLAVALIGGEALAVWNSLQNRLDRRKVTRQGGVTATADREEISE